MKINGEKAGLYETVVVIPRGDKRIVFKLKAVEKPDDYEKVCPRPIPPNKTIPGGPKGRIVPNFDDPGYKEQFRAWVSGQYNWIYIQTLRETEGLVWEQVKLDDPATFDKWQDELIEFGLSSPEANILFDRIREVNGLSEAKLEQERERFLSEQQQGQDQ